MKKIIVVVGPTSVGKTKMGVELAKKFNGEVISGDSMQIYRMLDIGSAKVTDEETQGIAHHLINIKDPKDEFSVREFQERVRVCIDEITSRGKVPILVGGTGLYIKAALYDYVFEDGEYHHVDYVQKYKDYSNEQLHEYLQQIDATSALTIHPNNRQRTLRAIGIYESTGTTKSETIEKQDHTCLYDAFFLGLTVERSILYERINQRVVTMMEQGLLDEIQTLMDYGMEETMQSMKGIGYREWFSYYKGAQTLDETIELIQKNSRNFAKRQYTWFNNQLPVHWLDVQLDNFDETIKEAIDLIKKENF